MTQDHVKDAAAFMAAYAKKHGAGAFATPTAKELSQHPESLMDWHSPDGERVVAVQKTLTRHSKRADFTGREYLLPAGSRVITHLAATPGAALPALGDFDYVYAYLEDKNVSARLAAQDRDIAAVRTSASAEMIAAWGRKGDSWRYSDADKATFTVVDSPNMPLEGMRQEVAEVTAWYDDFPFYSDGTWSAVSLRGYKPDDPQWGVKPSEMPRKWLDEHPGALDLQLGWTTLSTMTPIITSWVENVDWWTDLERVRLFRMAAKASRDGKLGRHSDIQDKAAGTRDGQLARFHIPIVTHPDITMSCWNLKGEKQTAHLEPGNIYYLDTRKPHAVANNSPVDRVHLVVDVTVTSQVRDRIAASREMGR